MSGEPITEWRVEWRKPEGGPWMSFATHLFSEAGAVAAMNAWRPVVDHPLRVARRTFTAWEPMA